MAESRGEAENGRIGRNSVPLALIVDDHPLFCEALSMTLRSALCVEQVEAVTSLAAGLAQLGQKPTPDVILLDLKLPDVDGLDGLIRLKRVAAGVPIIVVSSLSDDRMIASTIQSGASGFIPKHSQREVFVRAFDRIWAGGVFTPEGFVTPGENAGGPDETEALERLTQLTQQQARILQLLCEGKLNKQIAFDLDIAETTVKAHLTAILRKLKVQNRTQAVLLSQTVRFAAILQSDSHVS